MRRTAARGFTLLECMVAAAVAGVALWQTQHWGLLPLAAAPVNLVALDDAGRRLRDPDDPLGSSARGRCSSPTGRAAPPSGRW